jgi:hypothetical protein
MADDFGREAMAFIRIGRGWWVHGASMSQEAGAGKVGRFPRK